MDHVGKSLADSLSSAFILFKFDTDQSSHHFYHTLVVHHYHTAIGKKCMSAHLLPVDCSDESNGELIEVEHTEVSHLQCQLPS